MEKQTVTAKSKYIRQSPYKVRLVLNLIRGLNVNEALNILTFTKRKAATDIKQLLESAIANAENNFGIFFHSFMGKTNTKLEFLYIVNRLELLYNSIRVAGYAFIVLGIFNFATSGIYYIFTDRMKFCLRDFGDRDES